MYTRRQQRGKLWFHVIQTIHNVLLFYRGRRLWTAQETWLSHKIISPVAWISLLISEIWGSLVSVTTHKTTIDSLLTDAYKTSRVTSFAWRHNLHGAESFLRSWIVTQVEKFPAFHVNRRFITAITRTLALILTTWILPTQSHHIARRSVLILSSNLRLASIKSSAVICCPY
jgi:hypothetical protein